MGVAFTNNWESVLDKLESVVKTEFGASLKTYRGLNNITEGNQYLRIAPIGSELVDYSGNLEIREFSLNLFLYFKVINAKKSDTDQVMRVLSRLETIIGNNITMTLSDNTVAYNCRIESTEIDTSNPEEYLINLEYKCLHQNNSTTPNVTITASQVADGATSSDSALSLTFTLNRESDNFVVGDIDVTNGSLSSFSGSGSVYTATFTPSGSGATTIKVLADKFTGTNATGGNSASDIFNWTYVPKFIFTVQIPDQVDKTFALPILEVAGHTPSFNIDWGDGSNNDITAHNDSDLDHTYSTAGTKTITIDGVVKGLTFASGGDKLLMREISNWGGLDITGANAFYGCTELTVTANNAPTISTTTLLRTFSDCEKVVNIGSGWDVSSVQDFSNMFSAALDFNGSDLVNWDTSSATTMSQMFYYAQDFNQDISGWNTSNVTNMSTTFKNASSFNQDIGNWVTTNVTTMNSMFSHASAFNQDINTDSAKWNVSNVTDMNNMFNNADAFNQSLNNWNVSSVTTMHSMFENCQNFNGNISSWNVSSVTVMSEMFRNTVSFNGNISSWNIANVESLNGFLKSNEDFNQDLSSWDFVKVDDFTNFMFGNTDMTTENYNKLLVRIDGTNSKTGKSFHGGSATATDGGAGGNGATARTNLETDHSWTIVDGDG